MNGNHFEFLLYPTKPEDLTNNDLTLFYIDIKNDASVSGFAHSISMFLY
jgi:hypothetical protein